LVNDDGATMMMHRWRHASVSNNEYSTLLPSRYKMKTTINPLPYGLPL
jgi:hypothetical protein